jgi:hypothetical protein
MFGRAPVSCWEALGQNVAVAGLQVDADGSDGLYVPKLNIVSPVPQRQNDRFLHHRYSKRVCCNKRSSDNYARFVPSYQLPLCSAGQISRKLDTPKLQGSGGTQLC